MAKYPLAKMSEMHGHQSMPLLLNVTQRCDPHVDPYVDPYVDPHVGRRISRGSKTETDI